MKQLGFHCFINPFEGMFNSYVWQDKSIFSIEDLKLFVLNVPGTYPAWKINGEMITGVLSPSVSCFPKELEVIIRKNWIIEGRDLKEAFKAFEVKKRFFLRRLKEDFDLMVFVIRLPDVISHYTIGDEKNLEVGINATALITNIFKNSNFDDYLVTIKKKQKTGKILRIGLGLDGSFVTDDTSVTTSIQEPLSLLSNLT